MNINFIVPLSILACGISWFLVLVGQAILNKSQKHIDSTPDNSPIDEVSKSLETRLADIHNRRFSVPYKYEKTERKTTTTPIQGDKKNKKKKTTDS